MAEIRDCSLAAASCTLMTAVLEMKLTDALSTPVTAPRAFSTDLAQPAQVMPSTCSFTVFIVFQQRKDSPHRRKCRGVPVKWGSIMERATCAMVAGDVAAGIWGGG